MSKRQALMLLGVWVMILFSLGFPGGLKQTLAIVTGAVIVIVAYRLKPDRPPHTKETLPYVESNGNGSSSGNDTAVS